MELNREECISELDTKIKYAKFANTNVVVLSSKTAQFCLEHAQYYEQKIKELTEENESARLEYAGFEAGAKSAFDSITKALIEDNKRLSDTVETLRGVIASKDKIIRGLTEEIEVIKAELETRPPKLIITRKA